jgi:formylglycine-generating enzyme required for sulfatase activity
MLNRINLSGLLGLVGAVLLGGCGGGDSAESRVLSAQFESCLTTNDCLSGLTCEVKVCVLKLDPRDATQDTHEDASDLTELTDVSDAWEGDNGLSDGLLFFNDFEANYGDTKLPGCAPDCGAASLVWVPIPGGSFTMGCPDGEPGCRGHERPAHQVTVPAFEMLQIEVTETQYLEVMGTNPSCDANELSGANTPVECVRWIRARKFCQSIGGRLPSEAEWEYAARAGTSTRFLCGDHKSCLDSIAWYKVNSNGKKHPIKEKQANAFGLFDMTGNVAEWTQDWYYGDFQGAPTDGSAWEDQEPQGINDKVRVVAAVPMRRQPAGPTRGPAATASTTATPTSASASAACGRGAGGASPPSPSPAPSPSPSPSP